MSRESKVVPFSLKNAPALIERLWPAQKISVEAQKERKAGAGQTLTALGSYWKGRKPLVLVRACVLGALLPATDDSERDLAIFEKLMGIDDQAFQFRIKKKARWPAILDKPYAERVAECTRPEESGDQEFAGIWTDVNAHLGTNAHGFDELVEQLGVMRFGRRPVVADTFAGGGSIPFEAAKLGNDVYASDLNPIACLLTWAALNLVPMPVDRRSALASALKQIEVEVERQVADLGYERDTFGNRAKTFLYCLETTCPQTGWVVPIAPSWVISYRKRVVAQLTADRARRRFELVVKAGATDLDIADAEKGTLQNGALVYVLDGETYATPIRTLRGEAGGKNPTAANGLRQWSPGDVVPRDTDVLRDRLYCIQWIPADQIDRAQPTTFFRAPTDQDLKNDANLIRLVEDNLLENQRNGLIPDMEIETGYNTDQPIRERGWHYWHQMFGPRQLFVLSATLDQCAKADVAVRPFLLAAFARLVDYNNRLTRWIASPRETGGTDFVANLFSNQALNTLYTRAERGAIDALEPLSRMPPYRPARAGSVQVETRAANDLPAQATFDLVVTDPPYADAVMYHEITEIFIAWLRRTGQSVFDSWLWDSRRPLAIAGEGESFRHRMVEAYGAMTNHMPDNGMQIVMFTHQSGEVWADMAQIFWGAGLQVMAAWYIATETTSELKKGGYVQGTVILVLRKRKSNEAGYRDEIVQEIKSEVANQIDTMVGLNQTLKGHGRIENLFEDADLQMAGYAAALRVLTAYARIDGTDMTREALRPRVKGEKNLVTDIIEFAVQVANEHLVPEGMDARVWERLTGSERFYCKMLDIETTGAKKLDNYQNFAKAFRVPDYAELMQSTKPNEAELKTGAQFKKAGFGDSEFGRSGTRAVLYALYELQAEVEGDLVLAHLRDLVDGYGGRRDDLAAVAAYIANKRQEVDAAEAQAARILHGVIRNERLGA